MVLTQHDPQEPWSLISPMVGQLAHSFLESKLSGSDTASTVCLSTGGLFPLGSFSTPHRRFTSPTDFHLYVWLAWSCIPLNPNCQNRTLSTEELVKEHCFIMPIVELIYLNSTSCIWTLKAGWIFIYLKPWSQPFVHPSVNLTKFSLKLFVILNHMLGYLLCFTKVRESFGWFILHFEPVTGP